MSYKIEYLITCLSTSSIISKKINDVIEGEGYKVKDDDLSNSKEILIGNITINCQFYFENNHLYLNFNINKIDNEKEFKDNLYNYQKPHDLILKIIKTIGNSEKEINLLYDEVSSELSALSYPTLHRLENKLRAFITKLLLKTFGPTWNTPGKMKLYFGEKLYDNIIDKKGGVLYQSYFITPTKILTKKMAFKNMIDLDIIANEEDIHDYHLDPYISKSYIERYFREINPFEDILEEANNLNCFRNEIAHNKIITFSRYEEMKKIISDWSHFVNLASKKTDTIILNNDGSYKLYNYKQLPQKGLANVLNRSKNSNKDLYSLSSHYIALGDTETAKNHLKTILNKDKRNDKGKYRCILLLANILFEEEDKTPPKYKNENNYKKILEYCKQAINSNNLDDSDIGYAYYLLGKVSFFLFRIKEAIKYYEQSAKYGYVFSYYTLAKIYENMPDHYDEEQEKEKEKEKILTEDQIREEKEKKYAKTLEAYKKNKIIYYKKSADSGFEKAQYKLAQFYEEGISIEKSINKAIYYFSKSASQGNINAMWKAGKLLIESDPKKAILLLKQAIERRSYKACIELANYYEKIILDEYIEGGNHESEKKVLKYFDKAKEFARNDIERNEAIFRKADLESFLGNYEQSLQLHLSIANPKGYPQSQYEIGRIYEEGEGIEQDLEQAILWYEKAKQQGDKDAIVRLDEIKRNITL